MIRTTEIWCDHCQHQIMPGEKMKAQRKPGTEGKLLSDFHHFHNREGRDCLYAYIRDHLPQLRPASQALQ